MTELPLSEAPLPLAFAVMLLVALSWCLSGLTSFSSPVHWILSRRTPFCMTLRQGVRMLFRRQNNDNSVPLARVMMIMGFPEPGHSITTGHYWALLYEQWSSYSFSTDITWVHVSSDTLIYTGFLDYHSEALLCTGQVTEYSWFLSKGLNTKDSGT